MKKTILLFLLYSLNSFSQVTTTFCSTFDSVEFNNQKLNIINNPTIIDNPLTPLVLNVRINVFNFDNGLNYFSSQTPPIPFGEDEFLDIIKMLNVNYNQFNIFFKYLGYNFYNSSDLTYYNNTNPNYYFNAMNDLCEKDAININFVQQCELPSSPPTATATHSPNYGVTFLGKPTFLIAMPAYAGIPAGDTPSLYNPTFDKDLMICHEMGHVLGLRHPYDYTQVGTTLICEHVTRDPGSPLFNASTIGDAVVDTPAQINNFCDKFIKNSANDGQLNPLVATTSTDCQGATFDFEHTIYGNFMSMPFRYNPIYDSSFPNTRNLYFTPGQKIAMRNYILNPLQGLPGYSLSYVMNTVESLYQPYKRTNISGNVIISTTDNGNGTANVCRNLLAEDKFQKGFTYTFPQNEAPDTMTATIEEVPIVSHHTYNYRVNIAQLAPGQTNLPSGTGFAILDCTRGVLCNDEPFIGGVLLSSETLLSMNVTIEELSAIQVKDPELFEKLLSQYYYKLRKETESGAKVETTFYKQ